MNGRNGFLIVTRHSGAVEWLHRKGITGEVVSHISPSESLEGKIVIGNIPLWVAAQADEVWAIEIPNLPSELRGVDISAEQMEELGAKISKYYVQKLD
mgnify:CR=1 FL=1